MSLTTDEEKILKKIAKERDKEDQISAIIETANSDISTKYTEIKAIETKRDEDIQTIRES